MGAPLDACFGVVFDEWGLAYMVWRRITSGRWRWPVALHTGNRSRWRQIRGSEVLAVAGPILKVPASSGDEYLRRLIPEYFFALAIYSRHFFIDVEKL